MQGATLDHTFGDDVDVHRVGNKMFAMINTGGGEIASFKAAPDDVIALVSQHPCITPGYYMNKKHWITIDLSADFDSTELEELATESYRLVLNTLPKRTRTEIQAD